MARKKTINSEDIKKCLFCGNDEDHVSKMIKGPGDIYICDECIRLFSSILDEEEEENSEEKSISLKNMPNAKQLYKYLDQYVVGQDKAKKQLSTSVYNHYKRIIHNSNITNVDEEIEKSNILLLGPTGSGKTFLAQSIAKYLNVPFAIADATTLTEAGYVGEDVENILLKLIQNADWDVEKAETGIIYIDEIDKIARKSQNPSLTKEVGGEGVQQALLKIMEGTISRVPPQGGRKHPLQEMIEINTKNILFICGGAFDGLDKIISNRLGKSSIGFSSITQKNIKNKENILRNVQTEDIVKFGMIPEFTGRVPVISVLDKLDRNALKDILIKPKNSLIKQYQRLLKIDDVEFEISDEALDIIADEAIEKNTGARGLRSILEIIMEDIMFTASDLKGQKIILDDKYVNEKLGKECLALNKKAE